MKLLLPRAVRESIEAHAASAYPEECCGAMVGEVPADFGSPEDGLLIAHARGLGNAWENGPRTNRYQVDAREFLRVEKEFADSSEAILGIYHSHPDAPAWPSPFDLDRAWPAYAYLILSVLKGKVCGARVWRLSADGRSFIEGEVKPVADEVPAQERRTR
ncbi:MAG: M67 family metallopeptidase [Elusimicrobiota bacterium]